MKKTEIEKAQTKAKKMLDEAGIVLPSNAHIEITDFGQGDFYRLGLALIIRVSEPEYASKWLVVFPGQYCPHHYHEKIKETFFVMKGNVRLWMGEKVVDLKPGDSITFEPYTDHAFTSDTGAIIEEVTNRQYPDDSIFADPNIIRYIKAEE